MARDATCHTVDCENADITITVPTYPPEWGPPGPIVCGVCGVEITDVVEVPDPEPESS